LTIQGRGDQRRTFVMAADFARALETVVRRGQLGGVYNIGTEEHYSVREVATLIGEACGRPVPIVHIEDRAFNDRRYGVDASRLRVLGWKPLGSLRASLPDMIAWYAARPDKIAIARDEGADAVSQAAASAGLREVAAPAGHP